MCRTSRPHVVMAVDDGQIVVHFLWWRCPWAAGVQAMLR
jgi:hypothetical protein